MSTRTPRRPKPDGAGDTVVQDLLAERRELLIANERLRLELAEATADDATNPRIRDLESEIRRLRRDLDKTRSERDLLHNALTSLATRLHRALH